MRDCFFSSRFLTNNDFVFHCQLTFIFHFVRAVDYKTVFELTLNIACCFASHGITIGLRLIESVKDDGSFTVPLFIYYTARASCGAVYCNRPCLYVLKMPLNTMQTNIRLDTVSLN